MRTKDVAVAEERRVGVDNRVLVLAATARDASLSGLVLSNAGLWSVNCESVEQLALEIESGAAVAIIAEELLSHPHTGVLARLLGPPWSDLPVLVLARPGADSAELGEAVRSLGNVTLLERPLRVATLLSAVRTALRARDRQYEIRRYLAERERTEELLRQADRRKDEFIATLGHELRNPLTPLLTGLELLKRRGSHDATVIAVMERQLGHLTRLVDDLLEVSRITRGLVEVRREPVDLGSVVHAAVETCRPAIAAAGHELHVQLASEPVVDGDAIRLTQVFVNLLGNASKYTNRGGRIDLTMTRGGSRAIVSVRDTGIGIPADRLSSVFDMFTQVDRASRRSQGGLGIGLTIVKSLVMLHGGRVEARSGGAGAGSEFIVELPVMNAGRPEVEGQADVGRFPPRRILVVDDNVDAAETLGMLLETLGATVAVAHSGPDALRLAGDFAPDTVLLDIGMPVMDGYEVARRLRARPDDRLLLVALTGWGQEHDQRRAVAAGFDHHMIKPPDLNVLRTLLWEGWDSRGSREP